MKRNILRDQLAVLSPTSGATDEYRKGVFVAVVSTIMACYGASFDTALKTVFQNMPEEYFEGFIPVTWRKDWEALRNTKYRKAATQ